MANPAVAGDAAHTAQSLAGSASSVAHNATQALAIPPMPMESTFSWGGYFQAIGVMLLLLAALWVGLWAVRKYGKFRFVPRSDALPHDALYTEAQLPLGPRRGLMVVRFMDKRLLLGVTDTQITLLQESPLGKDDDHVQFKEILDKETQSAR